MSPRRKRLTRGSMLGTLVLVQRLRASAPLLGTQLDPPGYLKRPSMQRGQTEDILKADRPIQRSTEPPGGVASRPRFTPNPNWTMAAPCLKVMPHTPYWS